jgi:para-nitrobenzyl esterase
MLSRAVLFTLALAFGLAGRPVIRRAIAAEPAAPRARSTSGDLEGLEAGGVQVFRGVPYAAPPVGALRWRPPQAVPAWSGVRSATRFGHSCWQAVSPQGFGPWTHEYVVPGDISEDCLYLNVWTPARRSGRLPVLVWIHGGGFNSGSGAIPIYDGQALARRGVVVVTLNYRVGVFGFLQHPELTKEAGSGPVGNFGLQDVAAALRWVQANITAFGGDPARVTLAGQSAGGMAVAELIAMPSARGLFSGAIIESGLPRPLPTLAKAERDGVAFAEEKGAPTLAALRALPPERLQPSHGANAIRFGPAADGRLLPHADWSPVSDVPTLAGYTADEGSALGQDYGSTDRTAFATLLDTSFGPAAARMGRLYPTSTASERAEANRQVHRDAALAKLYGWAVDRSRSSRTPVYAYLFTHVLPGPQAGRWGAFHSSEIPYVFGTLDAAPERHVAASDRALSVMMACYWTTFIAVGRPSCPGAPAWPALAPDHPELMQLDLSPKVQPVLPAQKLEVMRESPDASAPRQTGSR